MPRLTEEQKEALRVFSALVQSDKLRLDLALQPGDLQLLYNHNLVHTRSAFTDHEVLSAPPSSSSSSRVESRVLKHTFLCYTWIEICAHLLSSEAPQIGVAMILFKYLSKRVNSSALDVVAACLMA